MCVINVGVSRPRRGEARAWSRSKGQPFDVVAETIKRTAFKITRVGQLVAQEASQRSAACPLALSICRLRSYARPWATRVAHILDGDGLGDGCGAHGTTAALAHA